MNRDLHYAYSISSQFRDAISAAGLHPPEHIIPDGQLHRFSSSGKPGDDAGWYVLHDDGVAAGTFGCWRSDIQQSWCVKSTSEMTLAERDAHRQHGSAMLQQRDIDTRVRQQQAQASAIALFEHAERATTHQYLIKKGVMAYGLRIAGDQLLIPIRDSDGTLHSLQTIDADGIKRFHPGGRVKGCYFLIGETVDNTLIVCEGYATGASIHEATGHGVAIAFHAGNLEPVASVLRRNMQTIKIIVAADDDWTTDGNPGLTKATAAAQAVRGLLAVPLFPNVRGQKDTDFNDLHQSSGIGAVHSAINAAVSVWNIPEPSPLTTVSDSWPEPTPLPGELPPVINFDLELMPMALRAWVGDIAHRMQCPLDFPAVGALVAISSLISARAVVQPKEKDDWQVVPNLWGLIIGRPGVMKSPALGEVIKPLNRLQSEELERWKAAHDAWALDTKVVELVSADREKRARGLACKDPAAARALLSEPTCPETEPVPRRFIVNDATVEKLGELMNANPWGTLVYRDEIHGFLYGMDKQGQEGARSFYLQSYDGNQGYTFDRIGRGTVHIPRVCLAMIGGIQPGRVQEYVRGAVAGGSADDGLLQRFGLAVWPDTYGKFIHVDEWPDTPAKKAAWAVFERLTDLQPFSETEPVVWKFSPKAQQLFVEWRIVHEQEIKSGELHPAMESHLAKYRKLIPALALIFALIDTSDSDCVIHEAELIRALAWGKYLRSHANRLYSAAITPETSSAQALLTKIKTGKLTGRDGLVLDIFTPREIAVKGWTALNSPDAVRKAAELLVDFDWLRREVVPPGITGGRPSERYAINPMALPHR